MLNAKNAKIGEKSIFYGDIETIKKSNISFGSNSSFGRRLYFDGSKGEIKIGNNCTIYDDVEIISQEKIIQ